MNFGHLITVHNQLARSITLALSVPKPVMLVNLDEDFHPSVVDRFFHVKHHKKSHHKSQPKKKVHKHNYHHSKHWWKGLKKQLLQLEEIDLTEFKKMEKKLEEAHLDLDHDTKLTFYGLYKQAKYGDNVEEEPGMMSGFEAREKWNAWTADKGMSQEDAANKYIEKVEDVIDKEGSGASKIFVSMSALITLAYQFM